MIVRFTATLMLTAALAAPALADSYPISGAWGQSNSSDKGPINCDGRRVITFNGDQRTDSKGGVPAYRNKSVVPESATRYRVVDIFTTGQISNGQATYTLTLIDDDHISMDQQPGGLLKLRRCK
jgi:hypothetical protein